MTEVIVRPAPWGGWVWACTTHGMGFTSWVLHRDASYDAIGHAAAHHPPAPASSTLTP